MATHPSKPFAPERWRLIEEIFHAACERAPGDRSEFLAQACGADADLRREVESLLSQSQSGGDAIGLLPTLGNSAATASPGSQFGPYRIEVSIGRGGMGEVWKAHDSRLKRDVAIKFSAEQFSRRFEKEAQAIAALNHPNICTLYDIGPNYLVMELVDGSTLAQRMARGPIPLDEAVGIAKQIVNALDAAHEKGIVHRDLKPGNIMIRPDGSVKVLDFGLAKAGEGTKVGCDSPTITMTETGSVIGTPGYMPPEQVRGEKVDKRADIWAFGAVLYELVAGRRAFGGKTLSDTLAAVMKDEPDWELAPIRVRRLLRRCLEKDSRLRLRDIGDAMILLEEPGAAELPFKRPPYFWIAAAGVFAIAAASLAFIHFREKPAGTPATRLSITAPEKISFPNSNWMPPAISPDGRHVVFQAISDGGGAGLWLRSLDSLDAKPLEGTEDGTYPFWSPDSQSIGFFSEGKLKRISAAGGPATALADATGPRGGTWSRDGTIVFAPTPYGGLRQVAATGGAVRAATAGDQKSAIRFPWFLPDGQHFVYMYGTSGSDYAIRVGSLDSPTEDRTLPGIVDSFAEYSQGHLLFVKGSTLMARPFDANRLSFTGDAVPLAEQVKVGGGTVTGLAAFAVSGNGLLVYQSGLSRRRLTWLDRAGKRLGSVGEPADLLQLRLSPDGRSVAVTAHSTGAKPDVWLYDVQRGLRTRFTFNPASQNSPIWSPDGRTIVFRSNRLGRLDLYRRPANGSHDEELLYADGLLKNPASFSPDGRNLAYVALDPKTGFDIWSLSDPLGPAGASKPRPILRTEFNEQDPQISPDGRWIAFQSNESGRIEVYVARFPDPGGKRQVSAAGGTQPRWRADGKELFYLDPDRRMMSAQVNSKADAFEIRNVEALFGPVPFAFDVAADGMRFLVLASEEGEAGKPLTVIQNWTSALKK